MWAPLKGSRSLVSLNKESSRDTWLLQKQGRLVRKGYISTGGTRLEQSPAAQSGAFILFSVVFGVHLYSLAFSLALSVTVLLHPPPSITYLGISTLHPGLCALVA